MDASTLLLYIIAVSAVMMTPGPSMLLALSNGASKGMRVASCGMAGAALSDLLLVGAVGCGLGALLQASEQLFTLVKWVGAAYLLYLARVLWRAPTRALSEANEPVATTERAAFRQALFVGLPENGRFQPFGQTPGARRRPAASGPFIYHYGVTPLMQFPVLPQRTRLCLAPGRLHPFSMPQALRSSRGGSN